MMHNNPREDYSNRVQHLDRNFERHFADYGILCDCGFMRLLLKMH
jgi:hypothetical protein